jgi:flagellar biosynthesis/type III secretory pathway chaperone
MAINPFASYLFSLSEECIGLANDLRSVLLKERAALITLNTDEVLVLVSQKESGMMKLVRKRAELKKFVRTQFNEESLEKLKFADESLQRDWEVLKQKWNDETSSKKGRIKKIR